MPRPIKTFWAAFGVIATVASFYIATSLFKVLWVFWLSLGAAGLIGILVLGVPLGIKWGKRVRDYPALLQTAAKLEVELAQTKTELSDASLAATQAMTVGIEEGRRQIEGWLLASDHPLPRIVSIALLGGAVALVAEFTESVPVGARYSVQVAKTGENKGVVEVTQVDDKRNLAYLPCVDAAAAKFWQALQDRADENPEAPPGIVLALYDSNSPLPGSSTLAIESTGLEPQKEIEK